MCGWGWRGCTQGILKWEVSLYRWPPVWLVWDQLYDNWQFLFLFAKRLIPTSQTGGQWYIDTTPFSIPWLGASVTKTSYSRRISGKGGGRDVRTLAWALPREGKKLHHHRHQVHQRLASGVYLNAVYSSEVFRETAEDNAMQIEPFLFVWHCPRW